MRVDYDGELLVDVEHASAHASAQRQSGGDDGIAVCPPRARRRLVAGRPLDVTHKPAEELPRSACALGAPANDSSGRALTDEASRRQVASPIAVAEPGASDSGGVSGGEVESAPVVAVADVSAARVAAWNRLRSSTCAEVAGSGAKPSPKKLSLLRL